MKLSELTNETITVSLKTWRGKHRDTFIIWFWQFYHIELERERLKQKNKELTLGKSQKKQKLNNS